MLFLFLLIFLFFPNTSRKSLRQCGTTFNHTQMHRGRRKQSGASFSSKSKYQAHRDRLAQSLRTPYVPGRTIAVIAGCVKYFRATACTCSSVSASICRRCSR